MAERYDEEMFLGFLEGDLTPERTAQFEKLLAEDARLRNLVAQLVLDRHRLRHMPVEAAPDEIMERVNQRLERRMLLDLPPGHRASDITPIRRFHMSRWMAYSGIAALVILGVSVIGYSLFNPRIHNLATNSGRNDPVIAMAPAMTPAPGLPAQAGASADRKTALDSLVRSEAAPAAFASLPTATGQPADFGAANRLAGRSNQNVKDLWLTGPEGEAVRAFESRNTVTNPIVEKITGMPAPDPRIPSLDDPENGTMGSVAKAAIPQFEQLMTDNPVNASGVAQAQASDVGILLQAARPQASEKLIRAWAIRHDLRILEPARDINIAEFAAQFRDGTDGIPTHARRLVLLMERRQVGELVSHLNLDADQSARLARLALAMPSSANEKSAVPVATLEGKAPQAPSADQISAAEARTRQDQDARLANPYIQVAVPIYIAPLSDK